MDYFGWHPDGAYMCKHVAAVLYGIGARLDEQPELLFRLREVDEKQLISGAGAALPLAKNVPPSSRILEADDLGAIFGLDLSAEPPAPESKTRRRRKK